MAVNAGARLRHERDAIGMDATEESWERMPEQQLAASVLWQALVDATQGKSASRTTQESDRARRFLLSDSGDWRLSRRAWCDQAGLDPDAFEQRAAAAIKRADEGIATTILYPDGHSRLAPAQSRLR